MLFLKIHVDLEHLCFLTSSLPKSSEKFPDEFSIQVEGHFKDISSSNVQNSMKFTFIALLHLIFRVALRYLV